MFGSVDASMVFCVLYISIAGPSKPIKDIQHHVTFGHQYDLSFLMNFDIPSGNANTRCRISIFPDSAWLGIARFSPPQHGLAWLDAWFSIGSHFCGLAWLGSLVAG